MTLPLGAAAPCPCGRVGCQDELCDECGWHCTSSRECVELSGEGDDGDD